MTTGSDKVRLSGLRGEILRELSNALVETILDPESDLGPAAFVAYEKVFEAVESLMIAAHRGNAGYEERDLPPDQRQEYKRAVHALNVLRKLRVE
jgi:hypothetical protein